MFVTNTFIPAARRARGFSEFFATSEEAGSAVLARNGKTVIASRRSLRGIVQDIASQDHRGDIGSGPAASTDPSRLQGRDPFRPVRSQCPRKSGVPDLRHSGKTEIGGADFLWGVTRRHALSRELHLSTAQGPIQTFPGVLRSAFAMLARDSGSVKPRLRRHSPAALVDLSRKASSWKGMAGR